MSQKGSAHLFLIILVLLLITTAGILSYFTKWQNPPPQITYIPTTSISKTNWQTYDASHFANQYGSSYKFIVQYPPEWKIEELDINNTAQIWLSPIETSKHKQIHIYFKQHSTLEQWINDNSTARTSMNRTKVNIKTLGKIEGVQYTGSAGIGMVSGKAFQLGNTVYDFFIVTDEDATVYQDLVDKIIYTFIKKY